MNRIVQSIKTIFRGKLAKSATVYTLSSFINSATPFLLLPILTRYLTTDEYGIVSMFSATASLLIPFMGMSVSSAVLRKLAEKNKADGNEYLFNALFVSMCSSLICTVVVLIGEQYIIKWTSIPKDYIAFVILYSIATYLCDLTLCVFQIQEKVNRYATFQNLGTMSNLLLSIILVVGFNMSLTGRVYGLTISKIVFSIVGIISVVKMIGLKFSFNKKYIQDVILNFGLPLIPTNIKSTVLTYTDRVFITNMINVSNTGIYSVGNQFSLPILILAQAFNLAYVPWLYKELNQNDEKKKVRIVKFTYLYFVIMIIISLAWTFVARYLIPIITGNGYETAFRYVIWLSLGYAFTGMHMMVVNYIYYMKKTRLYALVTVLIIFTNIVLNYFFINSNGAVGAAQATLISNVISFILTWILSARVCKMPWFSILTRRK